MPRAVESERAKQAAARRRHAAKAKAAVARVPTPQRRGTFGRQPAKRARIAEVSLDTKLCAAGGAGDVVAEALRVHSELLVAFTSLKRRDSSNWTEVCEDAEARVRELYPRLLELFHSLLPAAGLPEASDVLFGERTYRVIEHQGRSPEAAVDGDLGEQLAQLRAEGQEGAARDALCALLAVLASHKETNWMEAYDEETPVRGYFAHTLASAKSTLRIACVPTWDGKLRPVSLLITSRQTFKDALESTDCCGPLQYLPPEYWLGGVASEQLQLGLQELEFSNELGAHDSLPEERIPAREVKPEPALRELLLSSTKVLVVDVYVALAPKTVVASEQLTELIQAEFTTLLRGAKAKGVAVVFQLGSHNPHLLARKVYMRPGFTQHGLRFGYLRWRSSPCTSWGREQPWAGRVCLGLQLP